MQTYVLLCICILILSVTSALDAAADRLGIPVQSFAFAAAGVLCFAPYTLGTGMVRCNAGCLFWLFYWILWALERERRLATVCACAAALPLCAAIVRTLVVTLTEMYFSFAPDRDILCAQMLLWGGCVLWASLPRRQRESDPGGG